MWHYQKNSLMGYLTWKKQFCSAEKEKALFPPSFLFWLLLFLFLFLFFFVGFFVLFFCLFVSSPDTGLILTFTIARKYCFHQWEFLKLPTFNLKRWAEYVLLWCSVIEALSLCPSVLQWKILKSSSWQIDVFCDLQRVVLKYQLLYELFFYLFVIIQPLLFIQNLFEYTNRCISNLATWL